MTINGVELSLDISNPKELEEAARFIENTRAAIANCAGREFIDQAPAVYKAVSDEFNRMYGPGVGALVCGEKPSAVKAVEAVCEFTTEYLKQMEHMQAVFGQMAKLWDRIDHEAKKVAAKKTERGTGAETMPIPMKAARLPVGGAGV